MQDQGTKIFSDRNHLLERAIVSQALREDRHDGWQRSDLAAELADTDPVVIRNALSCLEAEGVVEFTGEMVRASRPTMRLNDLDLIAV